VCFEAGALLACHQLNVCKVNKASEIVPEIGAHLTPDPYTAIVRGLNNTTGVSLV